MGDRLPIFPLSTVLFPHAALPLYVFEARYRMMTKECLEGDRLFGVVLISKGSEVGGGETRVSVGTAAQIETASHMRDGRSLLLVRGVARFRVVKWLPDDPYPQGVVEWLDEGPVGSETAGRLVTARAAVQRARALLSELRDVPPLASDPPGGVTRMSWWLCDEAPVSAWDRQRLLESQDLRGRLGLIEELAGSVSDDLSRLLGSQ